MTFHVKPPPYENDEGTSNPRYYSCSGAKIEPQYSLDTSSKGGNIEWEGSGRSNMDLADWIFFYNKPVKRNLQPFQETRLF
ncbi:hypothetical protein NPIL_33981 [Nephila pilipes]|uniref:Uncharacterized protein n=1 Tax=Nephila pilipes TaxID=299642 RepID=A0A8X6TRG8_NEPPI|nr:hypothetical protein NPIL_33981 [Nephila pilipes]